MPSENHNELTSTPGLISSQELIQVIQAAAASGVTCLEWGGARIVFASRHDHLEDDDFESPEDDDEEEYTDHEDEDDGEDLQELEFKGGASDTANMREVPRPLQLNQEYDNWSAAVAPPVFKEDD